MVRTFQNTEPFARLNIVGSCSERFSVYIREQQMLGLLGGHILQMQMQHFLFVGV